MDVQVAVMAECSAEQRVGKTPHTCRRVSEVHTETSRSSHQLGISAHTGTCHSGVFDGVSVGRGGEESKLTTRPRPRGLTLIDFR